MLVFSLRIMSSMGSGSVNRSLRSPSAKVAHSCWRSIATVGVIVADPKVLVAGMMVTVRLVPAPASLMFGEDEDLVAQLVVTIRSGIGYPVIVNVIASVGVSS